ncbi:MAG: hypothetical protein DCF30_09310 [Hyphomicrobiales bacterium]|nr:MAG: hypothetical protein DCF30_09310 [Hyphomicrobiales bacterium]
MAFPRSMSVDDDDANTPPATWLRKLSRLRAKRREAAERERYDTADEFNRKIEQMASFARLKGWQLPTE